MKKGTNDANAVLQMKQMEKRVNNQKLFLVLKLVLFMKKWMDEIVSLRTLHPLNKMWVTNEQEKP